MQKLQLIAGDIRSRGGQAAYCGVDVTDVGECRELIDTSMVGLHGGGTVILEVKYNRYLPHFLRGPLSTLQTQATSVSTVSYTHLDVYKRQL